MKCRNPPIVFTRIHGLKVRLPVFVATSFILSLVFYHKHFHDVHCPSPPRHLQKWGLCNSVHYTP